MNSLGSQWPFLVAMIALILASGLFSGSEAALFSLHEHDVKRLGKAGSAGRVVKNLLAMPDRLLAAILFWNLLINMTYFTLVAIVSAKLSFSGLFTISSLLAIIFFSEMLPKSIAVMTPVRISLGVGIPMTLAVSMVGPILPIVKAANEAAGRLLWPSFQPEPEMELSDIGRAIELSTDDAVLRRRERGALRSLVAMAEMRADEMMRPRSKLQVVTRPLTSALLADGTPRGGYWIVADSDDRSGQSIIGSIAVQLLRPQQIDDLESAMEPVLHVPWSARVSQIFDQLNQQGFSIAVVVNEFGDVVGALSVEDILRSVLASTGQLDAAEDQIKQIGANHYRMPGSTSLRSLTKTLAIDFPEERTATVSGHLQRHNERVPRVGDIAPLDRYELVVTDEIKEEIWIEAWLGPNASGEPA